jgi:hypothetical protein
MGQSSPLASRADEEPDEKAQALGRGTLVQPEWPIHVKYADGEELVLDTSEEAETGLEWFDSEDGDATATVSDDEGRPVHLVVEALKLKICELKTESVPAKRGSR